MGLFDSVTKKLTDTAAKVSETAKNVKPEDLQKGFSKIVDEAGNATRTVGETAARVAENAKNVKPEDISKNAAKMVSDAGAAISRHNAERKETQENAKAALNQVRSAEPSLTVRNTLIIVYLMMSADRRISAEEEQTFDSIARETDPQYEEHRKELIEECDGIIQKAEKAADYSQCLQEHISEAIRQSENAAETAVNGRLMVWNLEAIAYADGVSAAEEQDIIHFTAKELKVDDTVLLEMEAAIRTMLAIDREAQWMKDSSRPYSAVEPQLKELDARKEKIMQGVHALLTD